jgi:hypothetical protein
VISVEIKTFEVEEWMNKYEDDATYNIAETCVESLKVRELLDIASVDKDEFFHKNLRDKTDLRSNSRKRRSEGRDNKALP